MHTETHERRAAVYARYSSDMQNPATIESQVHECQAYAERHSIRVLPDRVYADEARSGSSTLHRSALHQMLSTVRSKACPFNVLLVWKFSRLCRSMEDSLVIRPISCAPSHGWSSEEEMEDAPPLLRCTAFSIPDKARLVVQGECRGKRLGTF